MIGKLSIFTVQPIYVFESNNSHQSNKNELLHTVYNLFTFIHLNTFRGLTGTKSFLTINFNRWISLKKKEFSIIRELLKISKTISRKFQVPSGYL